MKKQNYLIVWLRATRAFSFTGTFVPILLAAVYAHYRNIPVDWCLLPAVIAGGLCLNAGTCLTNEYYDHKNKVDKEDSLGSSRVIFEKLLTPEKILHVSFVFYFLAAVLGVYFVYLRGPVMLAIILIAIFGAYAYTGWPFYWKYFALGEPMVFILMGPLMSEGAFLALTGKLGSAVAYASIPAGLLVTAILNANNLRDIHHDRSAGIKTIGTFLGNERMKLLYLSLIILPYFFVAIMAFLKVIPMSSLLVILTLPIAFGLIKIAYGDDMKKLISLDISTAKLHLAFGALYLISFLIG